MSDPYSILGVDRNATDEDVKRAYRKLSRQYHPDANINNPKKDEAEAKFKEVQQAYQQIMDEREKGYTSGYGSSDGSGYGGYDPFGGFGGFGSYGYGSAGSTGRTSGMSEEDAHRMRQLITYEADIIKRLLTYLTESVSIVQDGISTAHRRIPD